MLRLLNCAREWHINFSQNLNGSTQRSTKGQRKLYTRALRLLKEYRNKPIPFQKTCLVSEHILARGNFSRVCLERTNQWLLLCDKTYLTQGVSQDHAIIAAAYLVWLNEDFVSRKSTSFKEFCSRQKLPFYSGSELLVRSMHKLLDVFANQLPYLKVSSVKKSKGVLYLSDILKYKQTILKKSSAMFTHTDSGNDDDHLRLKTMDMNKPMGLSIRQRYRKQNSSTDHSSTNFEMPAHLTMHDLDKQDLDDDEFSDTEISSYLLSSEEIKAKQNEIL